ncbi:MAG: MarR family transcriptional regulator [Muribaculaceae bacterium]|nr:MarR family transcriptional regulator [Muribaculaceae bacterium]
MVTDMDINSALNEVLVKLFRNINAIEEQAVRTEEYKDVTTNDMHVIEAIGMEEKKNMTTVAKALHVTTGTLTIAVNSLVKKGYVERIRSEKDRRVVMIYLTERGKGVFLHHAHFHEQMIDAVVEQLSEEEKEVLEKALSRINQFFLSQRKD